MPDAAWKALERRIARDLGTERTPLSGGSSRITRSDTLDPDLYVEVKLRSKHSVFTLFKEVRVNAQEEGKRPIAVLHEKHHPGSLAVIDWAWFCELYETWKEYHDRHSHGDA